MAGPDLSVLVSAVEVETIIVSVMSVFAAWCVVELTRSAVRLVLMAVRGDEIEYDPDGFDPWDGYTAEDDARDRQRNGLS